MSSQLHTTGGFSPDEKPPLPFPHESDILSERF